MWNLRYHTSRRVPEQRWQSVLRKGLPSMYYFLSCLYYKMCHFFRNNLASSATTVNGILLERCFKQVKITFTQLVQGAPSAATFLVTVKRCTFKGLPFGIQGADQALEKSWKWTASLKIRWAGLARRSTTTSHDAYPKDCHFLIHPCIAIVLPNYWKP